MTNDEEQQALFALNQTVAFFGKELDDMQVKLWMRALRKHPLELIRKSLADYTEQGRFAPKPRDILENIDGYKDASRRQDSYEMLEKQPSPPADLLTAKYWSWAIRQWGGCGASLYSDPKLTETEVEEAVLRVNQDVRKSGSWESIPAHIWLESVHGKPYPQVES